MLNLSKTDIEAAFSDATLYLDMVGILTIAWQWLRQAMVAQKALNDNPSVDTDFYQGKIMTAKYFYAYELSRVEGLAKQLMSDDKLTVEMQNAWF